MAPQKPDPTPQETFLAPLIRIVRKSPTIEGLVFWGGATGWDISLIHIFEPHRP